jgi:CO dehydrogenase/acetyl-CoA synthase delta subunit
VEGVPAEWGPYATRAILWEVITATALLHSGADIVVLRHPESVRLVRWAIDELMSGQV